MSLNSSLEGGVELSETTGVLQTPLADKSDTPRKGRIFARDTVCSFLPEREQEENSNS